MTADQKRCWGSIFNRCEGGISREHLISKNQFPGENTISVQGFSWCKEKPKTVGINSLTAKHLCRKHNTALSSVDAEAGKLLKAFLDDAQRITTFSPRQARRTHRMSGDLIERWLLKTTINLALVGNTRPTGGLFGADGNPESRYVMIAFGEDSFAAPEGLNWVAAIGETLSQPLGTVRFQSYMLDNALVAAFIGFHGHRLWLALDGAPEIKDAMRPINAIELAASNTCIRFHWSSRRRRHHAALLKAR